MICLYTYGVYFKIPVYGKTGKHYSANARGYVLNLPLTSEDVEKFKTRRTHTETIGNRVGDSGAIKFEKEFRIKKIGMIC
jgi:hypothetical protein